MTLRDLAAYRREVLRLRRLRALVKASERRVAELVKQSVG